ncbi:hypothetical protein jhhlp_008426 [Lomentospora prolificans]|uniref:Protein BFR2 n=1 Tax=Lomentospora prolificans TaxID=41688 RepID=A0A2N3MXZ7_9PEZI|nr:hypothetical protein jhhlp_008426 [Lomentospora prolificans]
MAPKSKSRAKEFAELEQRPSKDFDPEDTRDRSDDDESGEDSEVERAGTEHYISVGKSKLRQKEPLSLGVQYRGTRVSREALEDNDNDDEEEEEEEEEDASDDGEAGSESDSEYDDPDNVDVEADMKRLADKDFEIDSDGAFGESDEERFKDYTFRGSSKTKKKPRDGSKQRPTAADFMTDSEQEQEGTGSDQDDAEEDSEDDGVVLGSDGSGGSDADMNGVDDGDEPSHRSEESEGGAPLGSESEDEDALGSEDEDTTKSNALSAKNTVLAAISDSARQDAEKGQAVRQQRKIFDGLLNIRVRLQKALIASNTFGQIDEDGDDIGREAYEAAEEAALKLWNTIDDLRTGIKGASKTGGKRKREIDNDTSTETIWGYMDETEQAARQNRRKVLDKWSAKIGATTVPVGNRLNLSTTRNSICSVLEEQLLDPERLLKRCRIPRSCAPHQASRGVKEDVDIYDDADFYQLLLKELVDQRSADSVTTDPRTNGVATVQWAAMKEAKSSKAVDRKASRGRKMRFTVHEKLQGFMAPEDRRSWEQDAIDRLFGSLFGQTMQLNEDEEESDDGEDHVNAEEAGLRLFRS